MIHPLLRLIATKPHLLTDHAEAYAGLVGEEWGKTVAAWKQRALMAGMALGLAVVAAILAGVALMLWAVIPRADIQAPWALLAGPGIPAFAAVFCIVASRRRDSEGFADLRRQVAADLAMLREVSAA